MTNLQIIAMSCAYGVALSLVIYFTRAPSRRVVGALVGGAAAAMVGVGAMVLGDILGMWQVFIPRTAVVWVLFYLGFAISLAPIYLVTWRVVRRFGWRGLAVCLVIVAVVGPPRDYTYARIYPEWMVFARGIAPVLADAAAYVAIVGLGHLVMRAINGPEHGSRLSRQPSAAAA